MQMNVKGLALAALVTLAGAGIASAQSPSQRNPGAPPSAPTPSAQSPAPAQDPPLAQNPAPSDRGRAAVTSVSGELVRVNPDAKTITVKNATGEISFKYSDQTVMTGTQKTVAGLATMSGEQVTVTYVVDGTSNMATKIEVKEKK
jgi:hypothetical protein